MLASGFFPSAFQRFVFSIWFSDFLLVGISMYKKSSIETGVFHLAYNFGFSVQLFSFQAHKRGLTRIISPVSVLGPVNFFLQLAVC